MKEIILRIRKKTKVPTNYQLNHQWRSDWKGCWTIGYSESGKIFKAIDGRGVIESDAQFAKVLYNNFGEGIYSGIFWRKGQKGITSFIFLEITNDGFRIVKKNRNPEELETATLINRAKRLKARLRREIGRASCRERV